MKNDIKKILEEIKEDNYKVPRNLNINEFVLEMMNNIGNTDP